MFLENPELRKNVWLEISLNRLILMPVILIGIYFLIYLMNSDYEYSSKLIDALQVGSLSMYGILVYVYGSRLASESVIEEVNERTWDNQRMTSVSPWMMCVGKLLGSTVYAWYGGVICVIGFLISSFFTYDFMGNIELAVIILFIGVFTHAISISLSLIGIRKNRDKAKIKSTFYFVISIVLSGYLLYYALLIHQNYEHGFEWYFIDMEVADFGILTIVFFTFWAIVSVNRNLRTEFQYKNSASIWTLFLITVLVYVGGLASNINEEFSAELVFGFASCFLVMTVITYFMVFSEPKYIVDFRLLLKNAKEEDWKEFWYNIPLWMVSFVFLLMIGLVLVFFLSLVTVNKDIDEMYALYPLTIVLFVVRDIGIMLYVNLVPKARRADLATFFYLVILYVLIPSILAAANLKDLLPVFLPITGISLLHGFLPVLVEAGLVLFLVLQRFQRDEELKGL